LLSYTEVAKFTKEEFQQYLKEMHFEWDTYAEELYTKTRIEEGIKKGVEQGLQQGLQQGIEKGALSAKREMAKGLRDAGVAISIISQQSGLSEEEIKSL
jgi:predicted transposase/invertase (TIGR01784 family)